MQAASAAWKIFAPGCFDDLVELHVNPPLLESAGSYELLVSRCGARTAVSKG